MTVAREDLALEAAYWGQLPGYFSRRLRKSAITSRNFTAMAPFHNYPVGRARHNHWGDALSTAHHLGALALFFLTPCLGPPRSGRRLAARCRPHLHLRTDGRRQDGDSGVSHLDADQVRLHAGHHRQGPGARDPDPGLGRRIPAASKRDCDGLQSAATAADAGQPRFPQDLASPAGPVLLSGARRVASRFARRADLELAIHGTLALDPVERRLSRLIEFLDATTSDGVYARLSKWCHLTAGDYAWAFDNPKT